MINLLIGQPGGGKSYEAVAFHLIPAIESGRRVITNLPLNLDHFVAIYGLEKVRDLIEVRHQTVAKPEPMNWELAEQMFKRFGIVPRSMPYINRVFANLIDYDNQWRHPTTGAGVLYIIDECHFCLPARNTRTEVEEWFSMHRHESADVLLITQSYGKVSRAIIDLVQVVYRVKKASAFGLDSRYIRKVTDGIRGDVVNTDIRAYDKKYFPFYQSHTKGGGKELVSNDIKPIYKHWVVYALAATIVLFIIQLTSFKNPFSLAVKPVSASVSPSLAPSPPSAAPPVQTQPSSQISAPATPPAPSAASVTHDPYAQNGIHLLGHIKGKNKDGTDKLLWMLVLSQNGQSLRMLRSDDLVQAGYVFQAINDCAAWLMYEKEKRFIKCDSPSVSISSVSPSLNGAHH